MQRRCVVPLRHPIGGFPSWLTPTGGAASAVLLGPRCAFIPRLSFATQGRPRKSAAQPEAPAPVPAEEGSTSKGRRGKKAQQRVVAGSAQATAPAAAAPAWNQMSLVQLKEACKQRQLKVTGSKQQLLQRLLEVQESETARPSTESLEPQDQGPIIRVILAEKRSAAENIARALGIKKIKKEGGKEAGFIGNVELTPDRVNVLPDESGSGGATVVTWASGHLFELQKYATWKLDKLPGPAQKRQYEIVRRLVQSADEVVNACDAGREGELIFREIFEQTNAKVPFKRLWISSLTDEAIKEGFRKLQDGVKYDPLYHSALARTKADWLIGMNATQAYTLSYRPKVPSFQGRETYWELYLRCRPKGSDEHLRLKYFSPERDTKGALSERIPSEQEAEDVRRALGPQCTIEQLTHKRKLEKPPKLFDLTSLQREANRRYGYTAERTLNALQGLYENHKLISYPRTDSRYLTADIFKDVNAILSGIGKHELYSPAIEDIRSNKKLSLSNKAVFDASKVSDHHAIIPTTNIPTEKSLSHLSTDERKLYHLIHTELVAVNKSKHFRGRGVALVKPGWRSVYSLSAFPADEDGIKETDDQATQTEADAREVDNKGDHHDGGEEEDGDESAANAGNLFVIASKLKEKDTLDCVLPAEIKLEHTTPPPLLTESSLLYLMETAGKYLTKKGVYEADNEVHDDGGEEAVKEFGLGTPATRAQTIERLISVKYVRREGKKLVPTEKGKILIDLLQKINSSLASPQLTGQWEKRLQDIAKGSGDHDAFIEDIKRFTEKVVEEAKEGANRLPDFLKMMRTIDQEEGKQQTSSAGSAEGNQGPREWEQEEEEVLGDCWKCGKGHMVSRGRWRSWTCSTGSCDFVIWKTTASREMQREELEELLAEGVTPLLSGFKSKAGRPFEARLAINQDNKVVFMFPFTNRRNSGSGQQRFSRRLPGLSESSEVDE